jgi:hypothetical protein
MMIGNSLGTPEMPSRHSGAVHDALVDSAGLPTGVRAIVQRGHRTFDHRPFDATLHRLVVQPKRLAHREKQRVLPISALVRPDSPVRFATAPSTSTSLRPHLRATIQSPADDVSKPPMQI